MGAGHWAGTPQSLHFLSFSFSFSHIERDVYHTVWGKRASVAWRFVVVPIPGNCVGQGVGSDSTQQPSDNF